jgi:hypothetical protein
MLQLGRHVGVDSVEKILKLSSRIDVGDVGEYLHFFLELIFEKPIVDSDHSFDVDVGYNIFHQVFGVEP